MSKIRIHSAQEIVWIKISGLVPGSLAEVLDPRELKSDLAFHERGSQESMQLTEAKYLPDAVIAMHVHEHDEIMYVVGGEMHFGRNVLGAGSSVLIEGGARYGFKAGPMGLRVLTFRTKVNSSFQLAAKSG